MTDITAPLPGYHIRDIPRGTFGDLSKIREEVEEIADAEEQGVGIMVLVELSDLYGALEGYLAENFPEFEMADLAAMADVTKRAFVNGHRSSRN